MTSLHGLETRSCGNPRHHDPHRWNLSREREFWCAGVRGAESIALGSKTLRVVDFLVNGKQTAAAVEVVIDSGRMRYRLTRGDVIEVVGAQIHTDPVSEKPEEPGEDWDRPDHYGGEENPFEPIKIIEHYGLGFHLGNALKYILRAGRKPGQLDDFKDGALRDLKKAYTYIGFEIRHRGRQNDS